MASEGKCPFTGGSHAHTNKDWWPNQLSLNVLHQHSAKSDPMGEAFDYAEEFKSLDLNAVIKDLHALMTNFGKTGGPRTSATTGACSFAWRGMAQARTASATAVAAVGADSSASRP